MAALKPPLLKSLKPLQGSPDLKRPRRPKSFRLRREPLRR
jgi:hypothetical protein